MSARQVRKMFQLMASGEPVELTNAWASVKKLARLAFVAQQFGYEYADARHTGSRNNVLKLLIVPDHSPQGRARAAQNWAQYPNAADGVSLPPLVPDAVELLKARIQFDLTGKNAEKRMLLGAGGITLGLVLAAARAGGSAGAFVVSGVVWVLLMAVMGLGFFVTRGRNAKFAQRLQAAGFVPVTGEGGRVRYLPPGTPMPMPIPTSMPPFMPTSMPTSMPMPAPAPAPQAWPQQPPGPYGAGYGQQPPGPYAPPQPAPGPYAPPQPPAGPYGAPQPPAGPYTPGPYQQQP
ncbi:hypothetical protein [Streptomyces sp. Ag109_O5-10]|uniref:hypothetical protein n=1 Tax=Streptomyces sp. Ag109_O5-10 TaxID=1855349 RepID=UPI0008954E19|nr:hypothetical protein [Streptomyces sp. Ag109_O5-10]SEF02268.1 hypothetical protein SAMN05216533_5263 [Streptomyces sp. Ag109_O5-10]